MLQVKELREKGESELKTQLEELSREIYQMNCELNISRKLEKPHLVKQKRRDRAKLLTILREKSSSDNRRP
ncbi:MAG: 50S ribosomal protein L29 [Chlamydiales bacterium]|nr:50S ribosomal protein L29 [Chlamydiales bacterium]